MSTHLSNDEIVLFWGKTNLFSQWYPITFTIDGKQYNCTEQWMMASKARLFEDEEKEEWIMRTDSPKLQKAYGRLVSNFNQTTWTQHAYDIVVKGNYAKFSQNDFLKQDLIETGDKIIAEASPFDRIWGIGLGRNNPKALCPGQWKGRNLLGKALMDVRKLINEQ